MWRIAKTLFWGCSLESVLSFVRGRKNMKCAKCGKEIMGTDYISAGVSNQKDIYVHSLPCEWYENEGNVA
jgi:hypothetical protein